MKRILLIVFVVLSLFQACDQHHHYDNGDWPWGPASVIGSGAIVAEDRSLPPFDSVDLRAVANVSVTEGGSQSVLVETDDNIIQHIFTRVSGGVLFIETDVDYDSAHGVQIALDVTDVRHLQITGVGEIRATNIASSGNVRATLTGAGTVSLSGTADTFDGTSTGVGEIDAEGLMTRHSTVVTSGVGECRTTATDRLDVTITGSGDVYYAGNPPLVSSTITGTGRLIPI